MNKVVGLTFVLVLWALPVHAGLEVDRVWSEHDYGYALVTFRNDTGETFRSAVTIQCTAIGEEGKKLNTNSRSFFVHERGPIGPGFTGTLKVPVRLHGARMEKIRCKVWGK